jgi:hypothetical protein
MADETAIQRKIAGKGGKSCRERLKGWIEDGQLAYSIFVQGKDMANPNTQPKRWGIIQSF